MTARKSILSPEYRASRCTIHVHGIAHCGPGGEPFGGGLGAAGKYDQDGGAPACVASRITDREMAERRKGFREFTYKLIEDARKRNLPPMTKQEMDNFWGMDEIIGGD